MKRTIEDALNEAIERILRDDFVRAILTGKRRGKSPEFQRIDLRPVEIKGEILIQSVAHDGKKDYTKNMGLHTDEIREVLHSGFANIIIDSTTESFQVQVTKRDEAITGSSRTSLERVLAHDHTKGRLLPESHPIFKVLNLSDESGRIKPRYRDKYIQIDQLLKIMQPTLSLFEKGSKIGIVDLASGGAALTVAVHTFLAKDFDVETLGIEKNPKLISKSQNFVDQASLENIQFIESEIASVDPRSAEIVLALHACDTATDDAIGFVIETKAKVALITPCCHQSRGRSVEEVARVLPFFGRDGIIDERVLDLVTDAFRGERLRREGYDVEIVEFVANEHTPRNLLIRAVRRD